MTLFPDLAQPLREFSPGAPSSVHTWQQLPPKLTTTLEPVAAAAARPRITLPARERGRIEMRPDRWAELNAERVSLSDVAGDAIRAALVHLADGEAPARWNDELTLDDRSWLARQAANLEQCSVMLAFREAQCGEYDVSHEEVSCHSRVCPNCERRRAARLLERFDAIVGTVPERRRSYWVGTVRNTAELREGWKIIDRALSKIRHRALFRGGKCRWRARDGSPGHHCDHRRPEWLHPGCRADRNCRRYRHRAVSGGVNAHEVTYHHSGMETRDADGVPRPHFCEADCEGKARPWHPHVNVVMDAPFIPQQELADTWRALTCPEPAHQRRGYCPPECDLGSPVVHIQQVEPGTTRDTIKYVTKSADLIDGDEPWPLVEFLMASRGKRMVQGWGSFFGVKFDEEASDEETVTLFGELIAVVSKDGERREVRRRYVRPRTCPMCGADTALDVGCTWELPVTVNRRDLQLHNGAVVWRPSS